MTCTLENHQAELVAVLSPVFASLDSEVLPTDSPEAADRILSEDLYAQLPIPAFTNSQMDGYAARSADLATATSSSPVTLPLGFTAAAGDQQITLAEGTVSPVMTGAMIPLGADTVIPVEESVTGTFPELVRANQGAPSGQATFTAPSEPGRFIRPVGVDLEAGALVAKAGTRLTPTMIAALVSSGLREVCVRRDLKVAVCTTGTNSAMISAPKVRSRTPTPPCSLLGCAAIRCRSAHCNYLMILKALHWLLMRCKNR
ncbi:hypothetical protein [Glutamicibacter sp. M10]|uniref:hypothetical protein n=1 Tax=Glutamicibacter sp. M10 TaxID=3023076 RepID=UPI0021C9D4D0|nr:hypothetical protein [Glutamicibacter sp. M10]UXN32028.1 hypothetical protein N6V40_00460 [Glutamicibacter sp. M10]